MALLSARDLTKGYGAHNLFEHLTLDIEEGERIGLVGPNGAGKTTLIRILAGIEQPDSGERVLIRGLRLAYVPQQEKFDADAPIWTPVAAALVSTGEDPHNAEVMAEVELAKAGFPEPSTLIGTLSGGWKKRLAIVAAMIIEPQVMLLDEPTNHLDLEGVLWLERQLTDAPFAVLAISHDRWFLETVTNRIMEISPRHEGGVFRSVGNYSEFLLNRDAAMAAQEKRQETLTNRVNREVAWLRRNPKAQTVKSTARVAEAGRLQGELSALNTRNNAKGITNIDFTSTGRRGNVLLRVTNLGITLGDRQILKGVDLEFAPGERLGLLGPNGSGKSTFLRLINADLQPTSGTLKRAEGLRVVYFKQDRSSLNPDRSLRLTLCPNGETVPFRGGHVHVNAWAKRFGFRHDQLDEPVGKLSGGEQARLLISHLMCQPADVLLLDEPTNDLDIGTLEVLEDSLMEFIGAVILVTHDRYLLDRVSTKLLALGNGTAEPVADYAQWQRTQEDRMAQAARGGKPVQQAKPVTARIGGGLSKSERREFERMEEKIAEAESVVAAAQSDVYVHGSNAAKVAEVYAKLTNAQLVVEKLYARYAELEAKAKGG